MLQLKFENSEQKDVWIFNNNANYTPFLDEGYSVNKQLAIIPGKHEMLPATKTLHQLPSNRVTLSKLPE